MNIDLNALMTAAQSGSIIGLDASGSAAIAQIMKTSKEAWVKQHHTNKISLGSKGRWRTKVGNPRKDVERTSYEGMIDFLYEYYRNQQDINANLATAFEWLMERKKLRGRQQATLDRNRGTYDRFITANLKRARAIDLTAKDFYVEIRSGIRQYQERKGTVPKIYDVRAYLQILRDMYDILAEKGIVSCNPLANIKVEDFSAVCDTSKKSADEKTFSPAEVDLLIEEEKVHEPNPRAYMVQASANGGFRAGELPCLHWSDIQDGYIHVWQQQRLLMEGNKRKGYEIIGTTKNEKGISGGGRYVPITDKMQNILDEVRQHQRDVGLDTDLIFCEDNGEMIKKDSYERYLRRHCQKLGFTTTNNHALRMSFNSNVLIPAGLDARERALIMGHSVETNERNYSHAGTYLLEGIKNKLNGAEKSN